MVASAAARVRALGASHPGPPVYLELEVGAPETTLVVSGEQRTLVAWLELPGELEAPLTPEHAALLRAAVERRLTAGLRLDVDGAPLAGRLAAVAAFPEFGPGNELPSFRLELRYAVEREPRAVGLRWRAFGAGTAEPVALVPLVVRADGRFEHFVLRPDEPEFVWHRPPPPRPTAAATELPSLPSPGGAALPLASLGLLGAVGLWSWRARRRGTAPARLALACLLGVGGAWLLRGVAHWQLTGRGEVARIDEVAAERVFRTLHARIYAAFAATSEEEVYALLAESVGPELVDPLYAEVYESLVLRGQGGAVCRVDALEPLGGSVRLEDGAPRFEVDWRWEVRGSVSHFGHEHRRRNRYRARYTVAHDGVAWRVVAVETLLHERAEEGGAFSNVEAGAAAPGGSGG